MENKITKLTPEQTAEMPKFAQMWIDRALDTKPARRDIAERGIRGYYKTANLDEPKVVLWVSNPLTAVFSGSIVSALVDGENLYNPDSVKKAIRQLVVAPDMATLISDAVIKLMSLLDLSDYSATTPIPDLKGAVSENWQSYVAGQFWANWPAAYGTFYRDVLKVKMPEAVNFAEDATECGWWWPHSDFAVVSERASTIKRDPNGQLHAADGPAIAWGKDFELFFWHGVSVPREWIESPQTIDPSLAINHPNAEQRRCAAEILGWERVLTQLNAVTIDKDPDPEIGELVEVEINNVKERFLRVVCGTGRRFALPVPPEMRTALEANAWTYNLEPILLASLEVRT